LRRIECDKGYAQITDRRTFGNSDEAGAECDPERRAIFIVRAGRPGGRELHAKRL
jgi:hypothetical protein